MIPRVSAILLAGGRSRRMGRMKQLLPLKGRPVISHCLDALADSGIRDLVAVSNPFLAGVLDLISPLPMAIALNEDPSSEMAESVRIGLGKVGPHSSGVLIYLSDYPLVTADTVRAIVSLHANEPDKILVPLYNNRRGHPCLFPLNCAREVFHGCTLKEIVHRDTNRVRPVPVEDEGVLLDMDTEEDYTAMIGLLRSAH